jgi:hypothetical protein
MMVMITIPPTTSDSETRKMRAVKIEREIDSQRSIRLAG